MEFNSGFKGLKTACRRTCSRNQRWSAFCYALQAVVTCNYIWRSSPYRAV